jgi:hypothetical protein
VRIVSVGARFIAHTSTEDLMVRVHRRMSVRAHPPETISRLALQCHCSVEQRPEGPVDQAPLNGLLGSKPLGLGKRQTLKEHLRGETVVRSLVPNSLVF